MFKEHKHYEEVPSMSYCLGVKGHPFINQLTNTWKKGSHRCTFTISYIRTLLPYFAHGIKFWHCNAPLCTHTLHTYIHIHYCGNFTESIYIIHVCVQCVFVCLFVINAKTTARLAPITQEWQKMTCFNSDVTCQNKVYIPYTPYSSVRCEVHNTLHTGNGNTHRK